MRPGRPRADRPAGETPTRAARGSRVVLACAVAGTLLVILSFGASLLQVRLAAADDAATRQHDQILRAAASLLVEVGYAESGQRGYLLTGRTSYLRTYYAVDADLPHQVDLLAAQATPSSRPLVERVRSAVAQKRAEFAVTIRLRRTRGAEAAIAVVNGDRGQRLTEAITADIVTLEADAERSRKASQLAAERARGRVLLSSAAGGCVAAALLLLLVWLTAQRWRLASARARAEQARDEVLVELSWQATHDALTGLPNRRVVLDRLDEALAQQAPAQQVAVMVVDLDGFKAVNDLHGHARGDEVLVLAATAMRAALRPQDTLARLGGDEFVAVCPALASEEEGRSIAHGLQRAATRAVDADDRGPRLAVSASVGLSFGRAAPGHDGPPSESAEQLLGFADAAMYEAKLRGRGRVAAYDEEIALGLRVRLEDVGALRQAIDAGDLWVAYQPVVDMVDGSTLGVEALLRWSDPVRGAIPPDRFIRTAEESGLILELGEFVLRTTCDQVAAWNRAGERVGRPALSAAVNVSARQFTDTDLVATVERALAASRLPASLLSLEITESVLLDAGGGVTGQLERLCALGVRIALDDFGTGYSSLSYLRRFPIHTIKIDRSFVGGIGQNHEDDAIVSSVIGLAFALNQDVIAEGIETQAQADALLRRGCRHGQGFLYARPLAALDLEALLTAERSSSSIPCHAGVAGTATMRDEAGSRR